MERGYNRPFQDKPMTKQAEKTTHFGYREVPVQEKAGLVHQVFESVAGNYTLQRFDIEDQRGQLRVVLGRRSSHETARLITQLRDRLPDCELSYVNMNSSM